MDTVFFFVSKIIWALSRLETLVLLALVFSLVLLWTKQHGAAVKVLGVTVSRLMLVAVFPVADLLLGSRERRFLVNPPVENVSNIVVLGGSEIPEMTVAWEQPQLNQAGERLLAGVTLANHF